MAEQDVKKIAAKALILGAGLAGASVAIGLRKAGMAVEMAEQAAMIGGRSAEMGCKADSACTRCNVCAGVRKIKDVWQDYSIRIHRRSALAAINTQSKGSRFCATLHKEPDFVSRELCTGCGACMAVCPTAAISIQRPAVAAGVPSFDPTLCLRGRGEECVLCRDACPTMAIDLTETARDFTVEADALVVATGYEPFDAKVNAAWGYGTLANVVSGWDAELQLAKNRGLLRPSDGQSPARLAFIQCVGSRSEEIHRAAFEASYCSTVCCAYALRMARRVRHANPGTEITVFYMDLQSIGKAAADFAGHAQKEFKLIRSRPYQILPGIDGTVVVNYEHQTACKPVRSDFDMVVLCVGMRPAPGNEALAEKLGVPLDNNGFFGNKGVAGISATWKPGVYVAGAAGAPMDMAGVMSDAGAVCAAILLDQQAKTDKT